MGRENIAGVSMRVGHGYDVHRFIEGNSMILGGITIPAPFSIEAHSDGDVIIHAVCDALLGAAALGDIGHHFPDTQAEHKGQDSREFLRHVLQLLEQDDYRISNVDVTVIAQVPKLQPHILSMRECLAQDMKLPLNHVNIKATTTEGLGYIGENKGLAVHAVVLIESELK